MFLFKIHLRPFGAFGIGKNPAFVVFCFDYKNAEFGNNDMVDLGGSLFSRKGSYFPADSASCLGQNPQTQGRG